MRALVLCLTLAGCSTTFFGAARTSKYVELFDGQIKCAFVKGWDVDVAKSKCKCIITDPTFSADKTFISMPDEICKAKDK